jgi:hypothetical protein
MSANGEPIDTNGQILLDPPFSDSSVSSLFKADSALLRGQDIGKHELDAALDLGNKILMTGDWVCPSCQVLNMAKNTRCFKCDLPSQHPSVRRFVVPLGDIPLTDPAKSPKHFQQVVKYVLALSIIRAGFHLYSPQRLGNGPIWICQHCLFVNLPKSPTCKLCLFPRHRKDWPPSHVEEY